MDPVFAATFALKSRSGLPADLLALYEQLPRSDWPGQPGFHGLASFWLERHLGFRQLLNAITADARAAEAGNIDPQQWAGRLAALGGRLVQELIGHHQIEDDAYFPQMLDLEPRLARGFDILDADHHALDALLDGFVSAGNAALQSPSTRDGSAGLLRALPEFEAQLIRHLQDEEDLIIPVILKHQMR